MIAYPIRYPTPYPNREANRGRIPRPVPLRTVPFVSSGSSIPNWRRESRPHMDDAFGVIGGGL